MGEIRIGTSGWHYDHWVGPFYPDGTSGDDLLAFYAERFDTVEINASFYRLPSAATVERWRDAVPDDFLFAAKASRYITHMKKLKDPEASMAKFLDRVAKLEGKLGPLLFQLPPRWHFDEARLADFLEALPAGRRTAFEFRDESWFDDRAYDLLRAHGAALCFYDLAGRQSPRVVTADYVFVRLHGPGDAYEGDYGQQELSGWAGAASAWSRQGHDVYVYFDNDQHGYAPKNAASLRDMLTP